MLKLAVRHSFAGFTLDAAFEAPAGVTALFGHSGSGKTTIVNTVAGLLCPQFGRISLNSRVLTDTGKGIFLPPHKRRIGYVFQDARLFPHMTVQRNLSYGCGAFGCPDPVQFKRIVELLGIGNLLDRRPNALSGGEGQRVALGRAILAQPQLLLMDEPLAALDEARKLEILPYFERLRDETEIPILYVSHAPAEVARLATTIVLFEAGRVIASGPAAEVLSDPDTAVRFGVRDAGAIVNARVAQHEADGLTRLTVGDGLVYLPQLDLSPGAGLRLRIMARDVMIALERPQNVSALNMLPAIVTDLREVGGGVLVRLDCGGNALLAHVTGRSARQLALAPGLRVHAVVKTVSVAPGGNQSP